MLNGSSNRKAPPGLCAPRANMPNRMWGGPPGPRPTPPPASLTSKSGQASSVDYRERAAPPRLEPYVECLWTLHSTNGHPGYAVLPDGCEDIIFSSPPMDPGELNLVGSMTQAQRFTFAPGQEILGIRFRPAMSRAFLP